MIDETERERQRQVIGQTDKSSISMRDERWNRWFTCRHGLYSSICKNQYISHITCQSNCDFIWFPLSQDVIWSLDLILPLESRSPSTSRKSRENRRTTFLQHNLQSENLYVFTGPPHRCQTEHSSAAPSYFIIFLFKCYSHTPCFRLCCDWLVISLQHNIKT